MKTSLFLFILVAFSLLLKGQDFIKLPELQKKINANGSIKVVNFWATWCAPCVKELPYFEKLNHDNKTVDVLLVSMDYDLDPNPDRVKRFIDRKKIQSKVVILEEENPNAWIEKIDKSWSGALPSTLIINPNNGKRRFVQGELKDGELERLIKEISE
jgi:thiol-disulfide isomerase/thioredoxin